MEKWMKNNISKIIGIFLLLQPILDLLTGVCINTLHMNITIGIVVRVLFLLFMCFVTVFIFKKKNLLLMYLILGLYFVFYTIGMIVYKDSTLLTEIQNLVRTFYFPILLVTLFEIREDIRISNMTFFTMILLYILLIFVPTIIGIGYKTYQITKVGTLGFFNSANEISGIISILAPILFVICYKSKRIIPVIMFVITYLIVILMVGTKTPLLTLFITSGVSILYLWNYFRVKKQYKYIGLSLGIILIACIAMLLVIPKTNFYKNIKTHLNYLGLEHVTEVFKDKELVDHFIFSSRIKFLKHKAYVYKESSTYEKIFGIGYMDYGKEMKQIEMDYFDIYYSHGFIGFIIYFIIVLYVIFSIFERKNKKDYEHGMKLLSFFLIVFLAFFTGHIITAPSVSFIVILLLLGLEKRKKKDLLFASYNMDLGGIEKALLNLVNRIDKNKYNVTIILEEKKGIFLDLIDKDVRVQELKVSNYKDAIIRKTINMFRKLWFKILNDHNYDFSCCYTTYSYSSSKLALMSSDNVSLYVHNDYRIVYPDDNDFYNFFETRNIREYTKIIFVSNENRNGFIEKYKDLEDKCVVFNNFVNTDEIRRQSLEKIDAKKPKDKKLLIFVGRLDDSAKRISRQINLVKEIKDLDLWLIGDGPDREKYEKEVKDNKLEKRVTFFGRKQNPFPYMKEADYVILTSDYEGFPVTYLEAITLNKQVITTFPTSDDSIDIKKYAYVISKDEKVMVKEVKEILKDKKAKSEIDLDKIQDERLIKLYKIFDN